MANAFLPSGTTPAKNPIDAEGSEDKVRVHTYYRPGNEQDYHARSRNGVRDVKADEGADHQWEYAIPQNRDTLEETTGESDRSRKDNLWRGHTGYRLTSWH